MNSFLNTITDFIKRKTSTGGGFLNCNIGLKRINPFDYNFKMSLDENDYAKYLVFAYKIRTMQKLNLKHPKTLNEKIQWLKIYDNLPIKTTLTDKVLVRDWIKEKIGEEYLKPVLQICNNFDEIDFDKLPDSFIIKCNHGCKWNFTVKDKQKFLDNSYLFNSIKFHINNWMNESFFGWSDFETQYKNIKPQIIIESLLREDLNISNAEIEIWCFNGNVKFIQKCRSIFVNKKFSHRNISCFDENFNNCDISFYSTNKVIYEEADEILKTAKELSEMLAKDFKFVRVDWMIHKNKLYFGEMTFTPYSGFIEFGKNNNELQLKLGEMLNLKGDK